MNDEQIKREKRRRRRIRNQVLAYLTLAVLIVAALAGLCFGVNGVVRYVKNYNNKVNEFIAEAESSMAAELENESASVPESTQMVYDEEYTAEPSEDPLGELVTTLLQDMTLEEMVSGMFLVTPEALTGVQTVVKAGESTQNALIEKPVGGLIYSAKNYRSKEQFEEMLQNTKGFSKYPIFFAVTAECGENSSFGIERTKKASEITKTDDASEAYGAIAQTLASYGINMNMAPVSEIAADDDHNLAGRTFGSDAALAAPLVNASVQALQENGVSAVLQKFPGTGTETKTLEELKNSEFIIYETAIKNGVDCIMVSNVNSKGVTGDETPDSLSNVMITQVLRESLGFDGVVITDALDDEAITKNYTPEEAAVAAIEAGADVLYRPSDLEAAYNGVLKAVQDGKITKERIYESVYRIYKVKYKNTVL
ncbi:MAG: beta-N-acetylhexosaminidase [Lachnospiraceae bacterium]|nr:beta-N-acetylhexosaminidase [Lachnospiraceae bacterium]